MEPTRQLADELYRDKVRAARAMTVEERMLAGIRAFTLACRIAADGIRNQFPDASEVEVQRMLAERLALGRRLEESP